MVFAGVHVVRDAVDYLSCAPIYVLPTVEHILDALKIYWLPRSFENLATERTTPHLTDFMQL